ncbi:hypothetical protein Scep_027533 [Stephania cephalantha]|uniref:Uncharacterized protein n=1 Tax=Stephania cephalantha TaxID=152367 RepID=A0AAP0E8B2_9MAGN
MLGIAQDTIGIRTQSEELVQILKELVKAVKGKKKTLIHVTTHVIYTRPRHGITHS